MDPFLAYGLGLSLTAGAVWILCRFEPSDDTVRLGRCMAIVIANWLLGSSFVILTGVADPWWFSLMLDVAAGAAVLTRPAGRWQAALGTAYCAQICMHLGYAWCWWRSCADILRYYDQLTAVAWGQLGLLGGWCGYIWLRPAGGWRARPAMAARPRRERVDPPR